MYFGTRLLKGGNKMNRDYIRKGLIWVATYLVKNLDYTYLEEPTWGFTGKFTLTAQLKAKELFDYTEANRKKFEEDVRTVYMTLQPNYRPNRLHYDLSLGKCGNVILTIWYEEDVPVAVPLLPTWALQKPKVKEKENAFEEYQGVNAVNPSVDTEAQILTEEPSRERVMYH